MRIAPALLLASLLSQARAAPDPELLVRGDLGTALDRAVQASTGGAFWGAVLVARDGQVVLARGYGNADYGQRPNTARSLFEIASATKPFTATAVLRLCAAGKLKLDDPLSRFFRKVPADKRAITIGHLLAHTSGLDPDGGIPYASPLSREQMVAFVLGRPLLARPGERFAYCNPGYALLAAVVEMVTREPFEEALRELVLAPAGMDDAGCVGDETLDDARVASRLSTTWPDATAKDWFTGWGYRGMGGLVTTVWGLWRFDRALRSDALLDEATRTIAYTPRLENYACGWLVEQTARGTTRVSHSGGVEGFVCNYARLLEEDAVVVVLSNGRTDVHALTRLLEETLYPPPRLRVTLDASPYELSAHRAAEIDDGCRLRVSTGGGAILLRVEDGRRRHVAAELELPAGTARKLADDLDAQLAGRRARRGERCGAGLYLGAYAPGHARVTLEEGLALVCMPRYTGQDDQGRAVVDERLQLIVADGPRGQWPLMVRLDRESARTLLEDLREVLEAG